MIVYDLLIHNARIINSTDAGPAFNGDIGIVGNRIVAIRSSLPEEAGFVIDAGGLVAAPGFVDAHTHDDLAALRRSTVRPKVCQGITSVIIGNCGFGMAPVVPERMQAVKNYATPILGEDLQPWNWPTMSAFLQTFDNTSLGQNVAALLAHGPLRVAVMGFEQRPATEQEIAAQQALVEDAMQAGAVGMSLGLAYVPGGYTPTTELIKLAHVVGRYDGVIAAHMRSEGDDLLTSINELLTIARQGDVAMHISHLKITGRKNWDQIQSALDLINDARAQGLDVTVDVYPYNAGSTTITQLLPPWLKEGGVVNMLERLSDKQIQQRVGQDFANGLPGWDNPVHANGWERLYISSLQSEKYKPLEGMNIIQASEWLGRSPKEALFHLILEEKGQVTMIMFTMDERDVDRVVQAPFSMIGSDGLPILSGRPHPRLYGTFPRFIERYVRTLKSLSLEQAIYKAATFACERFKLPDRGVIAEGKIADLVIFDPATISDKATYDHPQTYPEGIKAVLVSGHPVVLEGQHKMSLPGQLIASKHASSEEREP
jgi:N-acyl-D-aspartate/D-glutamate deacylase